MKTPDHQQSSATLGVICAIAAATVFSTGGILVRRIDLPAWDVSFWRAVLLVVTLVFAAFGLAGWGLTWQLDYLADDLPGYRANIRAKIADELPRWRQTVLTTFSVSTDLRHLDAVVDLVRG